MTSPVIYFAHDVEQDTNQSVVDVHGRYDMTRFSRNEVDTIVSVILAAKRYYPPKYFSLGLVNESFCIVYKARTILHEIIIQLFLPSDDPVDMFAVALAYSTRGAAFRPHAIRFFEKSISQITADFMSMFFHTQPYYVYSLFSSLYEKEHDYGKALYYLRLAQSFNDDPFIDLSKRIALLEEKKLNPPRRRPRKQSQEDIEHDELVTYAANCFISRCFPSK